MRDNIILCSLFIFDQDHNILTLGCVQQPSGQKIKKL